MASRLNSIARILFQAKATTVASRSAPAAIAGPLQRLFGGTPTEEEEEDAGIEEDRIEETNDEPSLSPGLFAALVPTMTQAPQEATATGGSDPIASEWAREERTESIKNYYRQAILGSSTASNDNGGQRILEEPNLSVPVGDDYIYLAQ